METLTYTEKRFLHELKYYIEVYKYTPTIREMGKNIELNRTATVQYYKKRIEKKRNIKKINNRNIEIKRE